MYEFSYKISIQKIDCPRIDNVFSQFCQKVLMPKFLDIIKCPSEKKELIKFLQKQSVEHQYNYKNDYSDVENSEKTESESENESEDEKDLNFARPDYDFLAGFVSKDTGSPVTVVFDNVNVKNGVRTFIFTCGTKYFLVFKTSVEHIPRENSNQEDPGGSYISERLGYGCVISRKINGYYDLVSKPETIIDFYQKQVVVYKEKKFNKNLHKILDGTGCIDLIALMKCFMGLYHNFDCDPKKEFMKYIQHLWMSFEDGFDIESIAP